MEFRRDPAGVALAGREGTWLPYPVEYKRGRPKANDADELQLCAQAMCLEEMLLCTVPEGSLFYGEPRRRTRVALDAALRERCGSTTRGGGSFCPRGKSGWRSPSPIRI